MTQKKNSFDNDVPRVLAAAKAGCVKGAKYAPLLAAHRIEGCVFVGHFSATLEYADILAERFVEDRLAHVMAKPKTKDRLPK